MDCDDCDDCGDTCVLIACADVCGACKFRLGCLAAMAIDASYGDRRMADGWQRRGITIT